MKQIVIIILIITMSLIWAWSLPMFVFGETIVEESEVEKPLWAIEGVDGYDVLNYHGYKIVSSNVNFSLVGEYQVTYQALSNGNLLTKKVSVLPQDQSNYVKEAVYHNPEDVNYYQEVFASCQIDETRYAIAYKYQERNPQFPPHHVFVKIMNGTSQEYSLLLNYNTYTVVRRMIYDDGYLVGTGRYRNINGEWVLWLFRINLKSGGIERKELSSKGEVEGLDLVASANAYYIVGSTTSPSEPFSGSRKGKDSFLAQIDKKTLTLTMVKTYALDGDDTFNNIVLSDHYLYLTQQSGLLPDQTYRDFRVLKIDYLGNIIASSPYEYPYQTNPVKLFNAKKANYLLVSYYHYASQSFKELLYHVDQDAKLILVDEFKKHDEAIIDFHVVERDQLVLLLEKNNSYCIGYKKLGSETLDQKHQLECKEIKNAHFVRGGNRHIVSDNQETLHMTIVQVDTLFIKSWGSHAIGEDRPSHDYQLMINLEKVSHNQLSKIPSDYSLFGKYPGFYYFNTTHIQLIYGVDWIVLPLISVENNQVYDKGLQLTFNGIGKLNGEPIVSGSRIDALGEYTLEVTGKDNEVLIKHFQIDQLSMQVPVTNDDYLPTVNLEVVPAHDHLLDIEFYSKGKDEQVSLQKKDNEWIWFIPLSTLIIGALFFNRNKG